MAGQRQFGGNPTVVFKKIRPANIRFANDNSACELRSPEDVFSSEELERIRAFTQAMGLDVGGMDILRDREDGRLYIVDVNKTDMGPPLILPFAKRMEALRILAAAFRKYMESLVR